MTLRKLVGKVRYRLRRLAWRVGLYPGVVLAVDAHGNGRLIIAGDMVSLFPDDRAWARRRAWDAVLQRDPCVYCGNFAVKRTVDHIVPVSQGGRHSTWQNKTACCYGCNQAKKNLPLLWYLVVERPKRDHARQRYEAWRRRTRATRRPWTLRVPLAESVTISHTRVKGR